MKDIRKIFTVINHSNKTTTMGNRTYIVLKMKEEEGELEYLGEVDATTHHIAKNEAKREFDIDTGYEQYGVGIVVVPKTSWHPFGV